MHSGLSAVEHRKNVIAGSKVVVARESSTTPNGSEPPPTVFASNSSRRPIHPVNTRDTAISTAAHPVESSAWNGRRDF